MSMKADRVWRSAHSIWFGLGQLFGILRRMFLLLLLSARLLLDVQAYAKDTTFKNLSNAVEHVIV